MYDIKQRVTTYDAAKSKFVNKVSTITTVPNITDAKAVTGHISAAAGKNMAVVVFYEDAS